jgi:hypothetical protein
MVVAGKTTWLAIRAMYKHGVDHLVHWDSELQRRHDEHNCRILRAMASPEDGALDRLRPDQLAGSEAM